MPLATICWLRFSSQYRLRTSFLCFFFVFGAQTKPRCWLAQPSSQAARCTTRLPHPTGLRRRTKGRRIDSTTSASSSIRFGTYRAPSHTTVRAFPTPYPVRLNETPVADACGCPCVTNPSGRYRIAMAADAMRNRLQRVASRRRVWQTAQCTGFGSSGLVTATRRCRRV